MADVATSGAPSSEKLPVPLLDLKAQYRGIETEVIEALKHTCAQQSFILGEQVRELEKQVAEYSQCKFGIGVSSGTDALLVALMAIGVGPGDEVITTPFTFFATGGAVARVGARPVFCDIDPVTFNLSGEKVARFIDANCEMKAGKLVNKTTGGTIKALIPVHLFGQVADMDPLMDVARTYGLKVIEDAAQAIGSADAKGRRAGSVGDIGCFSFFPSKNLGAFGDGGMCTANDPELAETLKILRVHGGKPKYYHAVIGGNFRLDELQAAILLIKLKHLDDWTKQRQENARFYDEAFAAAGCAEFVETPKSIPGARHIYNQYVLRVARRDELRAYLTDEKIGTEIYYPVPLHLQKCFDYLGYAEGDCPESEIAANGTVAIPIYPELSDAQKSRVVDVIAQFYRR